MRAKLLRAFLPILVLLLAALVAGCGSDDDSDTSDTEAFKTDFPAPTEPPEDAQSGGTLEVLAASDVDFIDPGAAYYQFTYMVTGAAHRTLLGWEPPDTEEPTPDLAVDEPEVSEDGLTVTFEIHDGVMFSPPVDREVTSADVEYAIERGMLPSVANPYIGAYFGDLEGFKEAEKAVEEDDSVAPDISGIETPDDTTIVFKLTRTTSIGMIGALSLPISAPVPEEYAAEFDAESPSTYGDHQVATGPYMIENDESGELTGYSPGKEIHLVRNPNWEPETDFRPAYLDEVLIKEGFDPTPASQQILEGESQVNGDFIPPPPILKQASQEFQDQLTVTPSGGNRYVSLNTTIPPFDDINVRKAVLAAADRTALQLTRGGEAAGPVATHFIPPEFPGFEEAGGLEGEGFDFLADPAGDPELAAEYMRKAGYESGKYEGDEELLMVGENAGVDAKTAEVAVSTFEELGFNVNFRQVGGSTMYTRFCNVPDAEVAICPNVGWIKDFNDGQTILDPTFNGQNIIPTNNSNWPELDVPEINAAMNDAALIDDPDERAEAWGEIDTMVTEQAPAIPFIWDNQPNIRAANVNGVINKFNANWDLSFTSIQQ